MSVQVGDKVQIRDGGIDVTNGVSARKGVMYGEGGPLWAVVERIDSNWSTGSKFNLPAKVTKIRCSSTSGVIVWQVQPEDIASQKIKTTLIDTTPDLFYKVIPVSIQPIKDTNVSLPETPKSLKSNNNSLKPYVTGSDAESWTGGQVTRGEINPVRTEGKLIQTDTGSHSSIGNGEAASYKKVGATPGEVGIENIGGPRGLKFNGDTFAREVNTVMTNPQIRRQILNEDIENIQNSNGFPTKVADSNNNLVAQYDYKIEVGALDKPMMISLEDRLMEARAAFGIPVHGNNDIARAVKYYTYNRFKVPDKDLAHNRSFTHVFFTRPDLNLLYHINSGGRANHQTMNNSETSLLYYRNPDLFKLLTDGKRAGDRDNFNMLLSKQITSFDIQDENLSTIEAGRSWGGYEMIYGDTYDGRQAGQFSCNFTELSDYSVINLLKLWITYISNVSSGAWKPCYNLPVGNGVSTSNINRSHVYTKTLDYAASVYVFKCGPNEEILYWTKYFGVIPINTGASALSSDLNTPVGESPKLNINFKYSFKRDLSPISLLEFNHNANVSDSSYVDSFNPNYGHSSRPFVGTPFVEFALQKDIHPPTRGGARLGDDAPRTSLKLRFRPIEDSRLNDRYLYRSNLR